MKEERMKEGIKADHFYGKNEEVAKAVVECARHSGVQKGTVFLISGKGIEAIS